MKRAMREGEFQSAGKTVSYTDVDTLQLASDLYQLVDHDYKGSPAIDATRLEEIIKHIHAGMPLGESEWDILRDIEDRYGPELAKWRAAGRDGQDPEVPSGSGRIQEAASDLLALGLRRIEEKSSPSAPIKLDRQITPAHLLDGALHDLAHSKLHTERLADPKVRKDPDSVEFHYDHIIQHVDGGIDHVKRLRDHLAKNPSDPTIFRKEIPRIHEIRETESEIKVYHTDTGLYVKIRESVASPPPNLREAPRHNEATEVNGDKPVHECGTCKMFDNGRCWGYGNIRVGEDWLCDSWDPDPNWRQQDILADAEAAALLSDIFGP